MQTASETPGILHLDFQTGALLLLIAGIVAMLTRRLRLPYSVGLVLAGIVLAVSPFAPTVQLTKNLVFTVFLPPLLFEAALNLDWHRLRYNFAVVAVLASLGVILSALVTATGMRYFANWSWLDALVFGALIAATDPVSVIATFKEAKAKGRLLVLIESESLLNDGTAAVAFGIVVAIAEGHRFTPVEIAGNAIQTIGGGILVGVIVALMGLLLVGRAEDHLVEITFTTIAAYTSFLAAERLEVSGVLATITAGLVMANFTGLGKMSASSKESVLSFWEYAAFIANSIIFLLIGMHEAHQNVAAIWASAAIAVCLVTLGRAFAIYPCCFLFAGTKLRVPMKQQHVLFWGGLRGAVALALALGLPSEVAGREKIVAITFGVVAFSVFAQGLTITPFLRRLGEIPSESSRPEIAGLAEGAAR
jgi:monovalent cation:H+ antiporter, CPA1 family